jgi:hypothetical protein
MVSLIIFVYWIFLLFLGTPCAAGREETLRHDYFALFLIASLWMGYLDKVVIVQLVLFVYALKIFWRRNPLLPRVQYW